MMMKDKLSGSALQKKKKKPLCLAWLSPCVCVFC